MAPTEYGSFYANALGSEASIRAAVEYAVLDNYADQKINAAHVNFKRLIYDSPEWILKDRLRPIKMVTTLASPSLWEGLILLSDASVPVLKKAKLLVPDEENLVPYESGEVIHSANEDSFDFANQSFVVAALKGKNIVDYFAWSSKKYQAIPPAPAAAVEAGEIFGEPARSLYEYYARIRQLFPGHVDRPSMAWELLYKHGAFEGSVRCPAAGLVRRVYDTYGDVVRDTEFRQEMFRP